MHPNFTPSGIKPLSFFRSIFLLFIFAGIGLMGNTQTCSIAVTGCPPPDLTSPACATKMGAPGQPDSAFVTWTAPKFSLNCGTGADGYNFQMKWDLPENKLAGGCWEFNRVQRTGQSGNGTLNLWKSVGSDPPLFATPFLYFTGATDFKVVLYGQINYTVKVYLVPIGAPNTQELVWTINVPGNGIEAEYTNSITPSGGDGNYKVRFVFETTESPSGKTNYVDLVAINAILASTSCGSGIDFIVTGPTPGYYAEGTTNVAYTANYTPTSGTPITASCPFSIVVIPNIPTITCPTVAANYPTAPGVCTATLSFTATAASGNCAGPVPTVSYFIGSTKITFPYNFPVGSTTVKAVATNVSGRTAECTFNVVVVDNQPPSIGCVFAQIVYSTNPGVCTSTQSIPVNVTDNCGVANIKYYIGATFTTEITYPYAFPVGTTTVRAVATDVNGLSSNCSYNVVVADNQPPVINCPANASFNVDAGLCTSSRSFTATATDNCGIASISYSVGGNAITFPYAFPVGVTSVTARATDVNGGSSTCSFTVTVTDNIAPTITCPTVAASYNNSPGQCGANLSFSANASDNCGIASIAYRVGGNAISFPYFFPIGTTTVAAQATDVNGLQSGTCSFDVVVVDNEPFSFICTPAISVTTNECGGALVTVPTPVLVDNCTTPQYTVVGVRSDSKPLTDRYPFGVTTITWTARSTQDVVLATCVSTVRVTEGTILVNYTFASSGTGSYPYAAEETATGIVSTATSSEPYNGTGSGAVSTGSLAFKANIGNNGALVIQPSTGENTRYIQFSVGGANLSLYGKFQVYFMSERQPQGGTMLTLQYSTDGINYTSAGTFDLPTQSTYYEKLFDLSSIAALNTYSLSNLYFRVYASGSSSEGTSAATRLEVDNFQVLGQLQDVFITCKSDIVVTVPSGVDCNAMVQVVAPSTTGRCSDNITVSGVRSDSKPINDPYPIGITTITWTATDANGKSSSCKQQVLVLGIVDAVDDVFTLRQFAGVAGNVLTNDVVDCKPATTANVRIRLVSPPESDGIVLDTPSGDVSASIGTPTGTYFLVYEICQRLSDTPRCDIATVRINVEDGPLPVTGLRLFANRAGNDVNLNWVTVSEQNTSHFILERSLDGLTFAPIPAGNRVSAAGTSNSQRNYNQVDRNSIAPVVYYRVRLVDKDGSFRFSNVVAVRMAQGRDFRVYPNPVVNMVTIEFEENGVYRVDLLSASGQLIQLNREVVITNSMHTMTIPRNNISAGMYELRVTNTSTGKVSTMKLIYQPR